MFKFIRQLLCDCAFKVITMPVIWDQKVSDKEKKFIRPYMMKECIKCGKIRPI